MTMGTHSISPRPNPFGYSPPASIAGLAARQSFIHNFLSICPDTRALWVPKTGDTTTSTSVDRNARTITWDATIASRMSTLGSGLSLAFTAASSQYGNIPDAANLSFGDGSTDSAFTIMALLKVNNTAALKQILSKYTSGVREYAFNIDSAEKVAFGIFDESANAELNRSFNTALATDTWMLLEAVYTGSGAIGGLSIRRNSVQVDDTTTTSGIYTAMENLTSAVKIGADSATPADFFDGSIAFVGLAAKAISADESWALKALVNSYHGLSL